MSALSDLLNSQPISAKQAAELAADMGISDLRYGTLAGYWSGNHGRPGLDKLVNLARVIPTLSLEQLQRAAWGRAAPLGPYVPPEESVHLTERQRRAISDLIKSVVDALQDEGGAEATQPAPAAEELEPPAPASVDRLALRRGQKAAQGDPDREALDEAITAHTEGRAAAREGESEGRRMRDQHDADGEACDEIDQHTGEEQ